MLATFGCIHMPKIIHLLIPNSVFFLVIVKFIKDIFVLTLLITKSITHDMFFFMNRCFRSKFQMTTKQKSITLQLSPISICHQSTHFIPLQAYKQQTLTYQTHPPITFITLQVQILHLTTTFFYPPQ